MPGSDPADRSPAGLDSSLRPDDTQRDRIVTLTAHPGHSEGAMGFPCGRIRRRHFPHTTPALSKTPNAAR